MPLTISQAEYLSLTGLNTSAGFFHLSGHRAISSPVNVLTWNWPTGLVEEFYTNSAMRFVALTVQRSSSSSVRPNAAVMYIVNATPVSDSTWTTIKQWVEADFLNEGKPASYSDITATSATPMCYRLILNMVRTEPFVSPAPPYLELCWDVALLIPSQPFTARNTNDPRGAQPRLEWYGPDTSWWP